jgi:hypothetical protein
MFINVDESMIFDMAARSALFDMGFDNQTSLESFSLEYSGDWEKLFVDTARYINLTGFSSNDFDINCFTLIDILWYGHRNEFKDILDEYVEEYKQKIIIGNKA